MEENRYKWKKETTSKGITLLSLETKVTKIIHVSKNSKVHEMAYFKQ